jgi:hypothetical protein
MPGEAAIAVSARLAGAVRAHVKSKLENDL